MSLPLLILVAVFAIIAFVIAVIGSKRRDDIAIEAKPILTPNEQEFFHRLRRALPNHHIFPQVGLNALLQVTKGTPKQSFYKSLNRFNSKTADFVVCESDTLKVLAIIELDDKTHKHKRQKDAERDAMLQTSGYRTIRFESTRKPLEAEIVNISLKKSHQINFETLKILIINDNFCILEAINSNH